MTRTVWQTLGGGVGCRPHRDRPQALRGRCADAQPARDAGSRCVPSAEHACISSAAGARPWLVATLALDDIRSSESKPTSRPPFGRSRRVVEHVCDLPSQITQQPSSSFGARPRASVSLLASGMPTRVCFAPFLFLALA